MNSSRSGRVTTCNGCQNIGRFVKSKTRRIRCAHTVEKGDIERSVLPRKRVYMSAVMSWIVRYGVSVWTHSLLLVRLKTNVRRAQRVMLVRISGTADGQRATGCEKENLVEC